jgi:hypothetical protein
VKHDIKVCVIEYSPKQKRVTVRGVWNRDDIPMLPLLEPDNYQNQVQVFEGHDHGYHVGFSNLTEWKSQPKEKSK